MKLKTSAIVLMSITMLILSQTITIADATHNTGNENAARNAAEEKSKNYDKDGNEKEVVDEKREAFVAYKIAFKAWKVAKENYKIAKSLGVQTDIDAKKILLVSAETTKNSALDTYKEALKKKAR